MMKKSLTSCNRQNGEKHFKICQQIFTLLFLLLSAAEVDIFKKEN